MNLNELIKMLNESDVTERDGQRTLGIVILNEGTIGGTSVMEVKDVCFGFDWDSSKILIYPKGDLTKLTPEDVADIRKSLADAHSHHTGKIIRKYQDQESEMRKFLKTLDQSMMTDEQKEYINKLR